MAIIQVQNLTKRYGEFVAVNGISFEVMQGECFGILGPNGAGKTTTIEMIEGLKGITDGQILLDGHDVKHETRLVKSLIGVQLQSSAFFDGLNLVELIETFASLYGTEVSGLELLNKVDLQEKAKSKVKELSGGQKQRLSIAVALVNDPKVLFLDEPTTGLDPQARRNLWDLITKIKQHGTTIVLTTHYMDEAQILCDRVAIMDHAKIIALDSPSGLLRSSGLKSAIEFSTNKKIDLDVLTQLPGVETAGQDLDKFHLSTVAPQLTLPSLFKLVEHGMFMINDLKLTQPNLEDVFLKLTGHSLRE